MKCLEIKMELTWSKKPLSLSNKKWNRSRLIVTMKNKGFALRI